jgi:cytochrome c
MNSEVLKFREENPMSKKLIIAAIAAAVLFAVPAHAEGDAEKGAKVFAKCKACHENEKGVNKVGPTLKGVVGRKAASIEGYKYSEAMLAKGAEGVVWDEATLAVYLPDPKAFVPKTKMAFAGLKKPEDVADIIAYLKAHP